MEQEIMLDADVLVGNELDSTFDREVIDYGLARQHAKEDGFNTFHLPSQLSPPSDFPPAFRDQVSLRSYKRGLASIR
jgi:hypothetical protein